MDKTTAGALIAVLALLVSGFVALSLRGVATTEYLLFLGGPVVSALVGLVLTKRTAALQATTDVVAHQTNSLLQTKLTNIATALDDAVVDRHAIAVTGVGAAPPKVEGS